MDGYAVTFAAIIAAPAVILWFYEGFPRFSAWLFALTAAVLAVGLPAWLDSLAALTAARSGLAVLGVGTLVSFALFWLEAVGPPGAKKLRKALAIGGSGPRMKRKYHRIRTPAIAMIFGTDLVLAAGSAHRLLTGAGLSATQTSALAGTAIARIQSGQAAHAIPAASVRPYAIAGAVIFAILVLAAWRYERRKHGASGGMAAGSRGAAPIRGGMPPGRGLVPARKGR